MGQTFAGNDPGLACLLEKACPSLCRAGRRAGRVTATENTGRHREIKVPSLFLLRLKGTLAVSSLVTVSCSCSVPSELKSQGLPSVLLRPSHDLYLFGKGAESLLQSNMSTEGIAPSTAMPQQRGQLAK